MIRLLHRSLVGIIIMASWPGHAMAAASCGTPNNAGVLLCRIDQTIYPHTYCNDGTQPVFWIHPGSGAGSKRWLIWLEGGGDCVDTPSCAMRAASAGAAMNHLLTSNGYQAPPGGVGILSENASENPKLYNANIVEVHYCSSDDWSGNYAASLSFNPNDPTTWNFEGRTIALAAIASLQELGFNFTAAKQVLLGGDSAGGEGITMTANDLSPKITSTNQIGLINDAGFALNIGQYDMTANPPYVYPGTPNAFDMKFTSALQLWHGHGDTKCTAAAKSLQDQINCYNSSFVLQQGYVSLPAFVAESQIDTAQLTMELCPSTYGNGCSVPGCAQTPQGQYATAFGEDMGQTLADPTTANPYSVFSPDAYLHVVLADNTVFNTAYAFPKNVTQSPQQALGVWLSHPKTRAVKLGNSPGIPNCK